MGNTIKSMFYGEEPVPQPQKVSKSAEKPNATEKLKDPVTSAELKASISTKPKSVNKFDEMIKKKDIDESHEMSKQMNISTFEGKINLNKEEDSKQDKKEEIVKSNLEEPKEEKTSSEPSISTNSSNNKEEEKDNKDKIEEKKENISVKKIGVNDLIFPIITTKKVEESKNPESDSLSALNNALASSKIDFYNMNLKLPDNIAPLNKFSNQISSLGPFPLINNMENSGESFIPNYLFGPSSLSKNYYGKKFRKNYHLSHFVPTTFSCSVNTHKARNYRSKYVQNEKEFFDKIIKIGEVKNITEFWQTFQHMKKPDQCPVGTDYHLFKKGIVPMWEDEMNKYGGKLSVLLTWKYANLIWEEVTFNFCKGLLPYYNNINGIVISMRPKFIVLSFWVKTNNNYTVEKMRQSLSNVLQAPSSNCMDFIPFN